MCFWLSRAGQREWSAGRRVWPPDNLVTTKPEERHRRLQRFCNGPAEIRGKTTKPACRNLNDLRRREPQQNSVKCFEVLAGAISWGFKSPSPHHRF